MFKLSFKTDNASFRDLDGGVFVPEVAHVLQSIAADVRAGYRSKKIMDVDGNSIGSWALTGDRPRGRGTKRNPPKRRKATARKRTTRKPARSRR